MTIACYLREDMVQLSYNVGAIVPQQKTPATLRKQPLVLSLKGSDSYA
jgi:hypothetical protein